MALLEKLRSDENLEMGTARALPIAMCTSEELFDLEVEHIFRKEGLCVGRLEERGS